jgi:hypothetical protein
MTKASSGEILHCFTGFSSFVPSQYLRTPTFVTHFKTPRS